MSLRRSCQCQHSNNLFRSGVSLPRRKKKYCTRCKGEKLEKLVFTQFPMKYPPLKSADLSHHAQAKEKSAWMLQQAKDSEVGNCRGRRAIRLATAFHRNPPTCQLLGLPSISINPRKRHGDNRFRLQGARGGAPGRGLQCLPGTRHSQVAQTSQEARTDHRQRPQVHCKARRERRECRGQCVVSHFNFS